VDSGAMRMSCAVYHRSRSDTVVASTTSSLYYTLRAPEVVLGRAAIAEVSMTRQVNAVQEQKVCRKTALR